MYFQVWSPLAIVKTHNKILDSNFLRYYLLSPAGQENIDNFCTMNTQKNIAMEDIERLSIVIPTLQEQLKIAGFLDKKCADIDEIISKTEKQIQRDKDFSDPGKNPLNRDPRTKKQIAAYQEKEKNRRKLLADIRQHKEYRAALGREVPKEFDKFREMKYNEKEQWQTIQRSFRNRFSLQEQLDYEINGEKLFILNRRNLKM